MIFNLLIIFITILISSYYKEKENSLLKSGQHRDVAKNVNKNRKEFITIISTLLVLQSGLRHVAVGSDTYQYFLTFERVKATSWNQILHNVTSYYTLSEGKDPGYTVFQKLFQYLSHNYQVFLVFIAVIFFSSLCYFIYKNSRRVHEGMFAFILYSTLFYGMFSITGIRQTIATAIALWGYELIKRRKFLWFLILILIGSTIHKSVLVFIPFYFVNSQNAVKYLLIILLLLLPFLFHYSTFISQFFQGMDATYASYEHIESLKPYTFVALNIAVFLLGVLTFKSSMKQKENTMAYFWYAALIFATFFTTQVFQIHGFMRIIYYFSIFNLLLIPHMLDIISIKLKIHKKEVRSLAIILLLLLYINSSMGSEYKFFWQTMELGKNYW